MKPLISGQTGKRYALVLTAVAGAFVAVQVSVPTQGVPASRGGQPAYDYSLDHDPATDVYETYRAF